MVQGSWGHASYALSRGLSPQHFLLEEQARNTYENSHIPETSCWNGKPGWYRRLAYASCSSFGKGPWARSMATPGSPREPSDEKPFSRIHSGSTRRRGVTEPARLHRLERPGQCRDSYTAFYSVFRRPLEEHGTALAVSQEPAVISSSSCPGPQPAYPTKSLNLCSSAANIRVSASTSTGCDPGCHQCTFVEKP